MSMSLILPSIVVPFRKAIRCVFSIHRIWEKYGRICFTVADHLCPVPWIYPSVHLAPRALDVVKIAASSCKILVFVTEMILLAVRFRLILSWTLVGDPLGMIQPAPFLWVYVWHEDTTIPLQLSASGVQLWVLAWQVWCLQWANGPKLMSNFFLHPQQCCQADPWSSSVGTW